MTLFIKNKESLLFLHVPKCGGSSIEKLFRDNGYSSALEMRGLPPQECLTASPQHQTSQNLKSIVNMEKVNDILIMVRNPYKRIISEFNWQFRNLEQNEKPEINSWIKASLEEASNNLSYSDNHFRPSIHFIEANLPCKVFKLEDGIEFVAEYFIREEGSVNDLDIPHEKDARSFSNLISHPELSAVSIAAINQFYKYDFKAFGYDIINTAVKIKEVTAHRKDDHIEAEKKVKAIMKWRETTINTLYHKIQKELSLINPSIPETKHAINKHEASGKLPHEEIQQSLETLYQEVSARM